MKQEMQLISVKALAYKALERNSSDTFSAKLWINNATLTSKKPPQKLRPEQPYFGLEVEQLKILAAEDWTEVKDNPAMLKGLDSTIPSSIYTKTVNCRQCGEIQTWPSCPDNTSCCQWCLVNNNLVWN